jgi:hypothetical protein
LGLGQGPQLATVIAALVGVARSAVIVQRFEYPVLRLLEGYWPDWLDRLRTWLITRQQPKIDEAKQTFQALQKKGLEKLTDQEQRQLVRAEQRLKDTPLDLRQRMPTALGNMLRAAERRPRDRYGLESVDCWPRLWILLPEQARNDVAEARAGLNTAVRIFIWGALFIVWVVWAWWAVVAAAVVVLYAYRWAISQAANYGDLLVSAFDLYRFSLYETLRWPLPKDTASEKAVGEQITQYLHRGYSPSAVFFKHQKP